MPIELTTEQQAAAEWPGGPLMVLAGAGTGKTTVIVERVRWLLETDDGLAPENILVLTYNVRAAAELFDRLERRLGPDVASRLTVANFHGFANRLVNNHRAELDLPDRVDVLDEIGQLLFLHSLRPRQHLAYHRLDRDAAGTLRDFAAFINRAKDELVTPADFRTYVDERRALMEAELGEGAFEAGRRSLAEAGTAAVARGVRNKSLESPAAAAHEADVEARREAAGGGRWPPAWDRLPPEARANGLARRDAFRRDAATLEILRLDDQAQVYEAYQAALAEHGAVDFGEQIALAIRLLEGFPNLAVRYRRQYRHVLVDEFQDANIAQVRLLELVGRPEGGRDDVVVVGDDDQSIYRFRGASYAAFEQFRERFSRPPEWDPERPIGPVGELPLVLNRRSDGRILSAAVRLVAGNPRRMKAGRSLEPSRQRGRPVDVVVCRDEVDEAEVVVAAIRDAFAALPGELPAPDGRTRPRRWSDVAVLSRRHAHRDQIVERLRREGIPFAVVGGTGLFSLPEIRDLEAAIRTLVDPTDPVATTRLLTAGPWRLDATEIVRLTRVARSSGRLILEVARRARDEGRLPAETRDDGRHAAEAPAADPMPRPETGDTTPGEPAIPAEVPPPPDPLAPALAARLHRLFATIDDLSARAHRDPPHPLLEEYLVRTRLVHDLVTHGTPEAQRSLLAIARLLRFVADWGRDHPSASLAEFVAHLDLFQEVGGDLETEDRGDADGVRLTTIHQAKGLEYEVVVVPRLVAGQFPDERREAELIPVSLLRQQPPEGFSLAEERRLLYVAMTRARSRLLLTSVEGAGRLRRSRFVGEVAPELGVGLDDVAFIDRREPEALDPAMLDQLATGGGWSPEDNGMAAAAAGALRLMPAPTPWERAFSLRRRALELIGALELLPESAAEERRALIDALVTVALDAASAAGEARLAGTDPLTLRVLARHGPAGRSLLEIAPLPPSFSHSQLAEYRTCPTRYAFDRVYRIPAPERKGFFEFGSAVHAAFEGYVRERREAVAAGLPPPGFERLRAHLDGAMAAAEFPDPVTRAEYEGRSDSALRRFWERESRIEGEVVALEQEFSLVLDSGDDEEPVRLDGVIDRIDRLPDGSIAVVDYKTGRSKDQAAVDGDEQLSLYALALREGAVRDPATGEPLPAPARLSLYFTEEALERTTTRDDAALDSARDELLATARRIRSGDFAATPGWMTCRWCDFRRLCPSRHREEELV